ncbi:MAG: hypothetical protein A3A97_00460 [Candidatus Terrybacteria bacterium RIFCSPLOWO2_01_FULL_40_23]|uniref:Uncharacterized protein n=1 Tax=Candidatus Terrybacteria bacterium RIFCSPLOWO2_01_FULL_40_23 TaxID=1802366 RepID=A0A1G2PWT5_9BACT|nr:MAG: hypothetical protein A3A97_00460 [Candidatus Terrybacteria bacterium RIFCSPLOWO2_01_FULL_40_23]
MFLIAFSIFILISSLLGLSSVVIAMHFFKFGVQGDRSKLFGTVVLCGSAVFFALILLSFLSIPWNNLLEVFYDITS